MLPIWLDERVVWFTNTILTETHIKDIVELSNIEKWSVHINTGRTIGIDRTYSLNGYGEMMR